MRKTWSVTFALSESGKVVSNASPLIYLAKAGQLSLLRELYQEVLVPEEVFREAGETGGSPDALVIASARDDGWMRIVGLEQGDVERLAESAGIETGEAAAILLARQENALLLIDDKMGRGAAEILGVACLGTVGVILQALADSVLQKRDFRRVLDRMIDSGFRLDSKVYRRAMNIAETLTEQ